MRKIKFNPELIGKPGIEVRVDGEVPDFIKWYPKDDVIKGLSKDGDLIMRIAELSQLSETLTMYRSARSAEEIAKEVYVDYSISVSWSRSWEQAFHTKFYTALVQSGMDEVTDKNE